MIKATRMHTLKDPATRTHAHTHARARSHTETNMYYFFFSTAIMIRERASIVLYMYVLSCSSFLPLTSELHGVQTLNGYTSSFSAS